MARHSRHGEYKVPGGKLVVVDLEVDDGTVVSAQLSGDFFLEPASALDGMAASLVGIETSTGTEEIAAKVTSAIDEGTALIGFNAHAVAVAVRRALE